MILPPDAQDDQVHLIQEPTPDFSKRRDPINTSLILIIIAVTLLISVAPMFFPLR